MSSFILSENIGFAGWSNMFGLVIPFLLSAGCGIYAFYFHKLEAKEDISVRRWIYGLYAVAFFFASIADYIHLCMVFVMPSQHRLSFHTDYLTVMLLLSFAATLIGVRRKR